MPAAQMGAFPVSEIPGIDKQNAATLGRLLGTGRAAYAEAYADGRMRATVRIPVDELTFDPRVLIMPHGGELELELINEDDNTHVVLLPSNGDRKFIGLVNHSRGRARIELDGPGHYFYYGPFGNDEGRGLVGVILVQGETPPEARLDRPPQPRP